jgi:hypothetical protein
MKLKTGILILCMVGAFIMKAQDHILFKGQTRDSTYSPISFANVMAIDTTTKEMKAFAVSDVQGNFQLRLKKNTVYELQITFVGFVPYKQNLLLEQELDNPVTVIMKEAISALDEVTIVAEMPVLVRGDTISYKAEAFARGDERKLEDVLEELPGFDIKDNGDIEVQGKKVDKLLVDGKEFFDGDTKLATQNIPADVVDRIQVLQNFNDIGPLQGLQDDDRLALNIELKGDKKRMVFGDLEIGGGPEQRYFGHANTFYYAPKTSINFISDANNIGELALTANDYYRMTGGMSSLASRNGTSFRTNTGNSGIPMIDRNTASDLTNNLGALNFTTRTSEKVQFSGFLIGFDNDSEMGSNSLRTYPQLGDQTVEQLNTASSLANASGLGRFSVKVTPNYDLQVDYNFFGKFSSIDQTMLRNSQLASGENRLNEENVRTPSSQSHQLRMFNAINDRNIISAELNYGEDRFETTMGLASDNPLFASFLNNAVTGTTLSQGQSVNASQFDGAFNYY